MSFRTGILATALLNGTELAISGWTINPIIEIARFANSKTGTKRAKAAQYEDATGTITYDWEDDDSLNPFAAPLSIVPGTILSTVKLCIDGSAGTKFWALSSIIIVGTPQSWNHEGKPALSLNWENNAGTIVPPGPGSSF